MEFGRVSTSLSVFLVVGTHVDLTLLHSCTLFPCCVHLTISSNTFALTQGCDKIELYLSKNTTEVSRECLRGNLKKKKKRSHVYDGFPPKTKSAIAHKSHRKRIYLHYGFKLIQKYITVFSY